MLLKMILYTLFILKAITITAFAEESNKEMEDLFNTKYRYCNSYIKVENRIINRLLLQINYALYLCNLILLEMNFHQCGLLQDISCELYDWEQYQCGGPINSLHQVGTKIQRLSKLHALTLNLRNQNMLISISKLF